MAGPIDELRSLAATAPADDPRLAPYLTKVRARAYAVTDQDVVQLKGAGLTEDEIFQATTTVAIEEGLRRLDAARRAIG